MQYLAAAHPHMPCGRASQVSADGYKIIAWMDSSQANHLIPSGTKRRKNKIHKSPSQVSLWLFNYSDRCLSSLLWIAKACCAQQCRAQICYMWFGVRSIHHYMECMLCNPFIASATKPWQQQEILSNSRKHIWSLSSMNNAPVASSATRQESWLLWAAWTHVPHPLKSHH